MISAEELHKEYSKAVEIGARLRQELDEARAALDALVKQIDVVHDSGKYQYVWSMAYMHAGAYDGPCYGNELAAARELLKGDNHV